MKEKNNIGKNSPLFVFNGIAMFIGASLNTDPHKHDCLQLTIDLKKSYLMKGPDQEWASYASSIVSSDYIHQLDSNGSQQLFIYLDKDSYYANLLTKKYLTTRSIAKLDVQSGIIPPDDLAKMMVNHKCSDWYNQCHRILSLLIGKHDMPKRDTRVEIAINDIIDLNSFPADLISQLASKACLSESRFRHIFKEHTGQSLKGFILWAKVARSLDLIMRGEKVVTASRQAGFWDGAHFDKTMQKLLGVSPGSVEGFNESFNMKICGNKTFLMTTEIVN